MSFQVRRARLEDVSRIAPWTEDTFDWGDYVGEALPDWVTDPDMYVMVCELDDGTPVAVCRAQMLSDTEAWLDAARVHPDHRRSGMGNAMNDAGVAWSRDHGAQVVRLAIEEDNEAAARQVVALGYRPTGRWVYGVLEGPEAAGSSGEKLTPAGASDLDAVWMFWSNSDLALAAHGMFPQGWLWRKMHIADLGEAIERHDLFQSPAGWVAAHHHENAVSVEFMAVAPSEAPRLLQALVRSGAETDAGVIEVKLPATPWMEEALVRTGFRLSPVVVYAKAL